MGSFYTSLAVRSADQAKIVDAIAGRTAAVSPTMNGWTLIWDKECESQDERILKDLGMQLSTKLAAPTLAFLNHDDDILLYWLFSLDGKLADEYNSAPGYFEGEDTPPSGGNVESLAGLLGREAQKEVINRVLRESEYVFAQERHTELVQALGLPAFASGSGYNYVMRGEFEDELPMETLTLLP